jgi:RNA polymerase sigma-70 factor (ECF subfamily)
MMALPSRPSPDANEAFRSEDVEQRLTRLLDEYGALLRRAIGRCCPAELGLHRDEIEQDARIRVWQALRRERNIEDPASYLYRIAATATIDAIRRVRTRRESPITLVEQVASDDSDRIPGAPPESPEDAAVRSEIGRKIDDALAELADNRRRAVALHLQGFTSQEIGRLANWSEPKARNLTYRGLKDLRERLRAAGIDWPAD